MHSEDDKTKGFVKEFGRDVLGLIVIIAAAVCLWGWAAAYGAPSTDQHAACTSSGGHVVSKQFDVKPLLRNGDHTGKVDYCEGADGRMTMVWNKVIDPNTAPH